MNNMYSPFIFLLYIRGAVRTLESGERFVYQLLLRTISGERYLRYRDDASPYITSPNVSSPYVISRRFYVPVRFIPEVWGLYTGLG
jgi:hypothetical protein